MGYVKNIIDEYVENFNSAIAEMVQDIEQGLLFIDIIDCFTDNEIDENLLECGIIKNCKTYNFIADMLYDYLNDNYICIIDVISNLEMLGYELDIASIFDNIININVIQCIQNRY